MYCILYIVYCLLLNNNNAVLNPKSIKMRSRFWNFEISNNYESTSFETVEAQNTFFYNGLSENRWLK